MGRTFFAPEVVQTSAMDCGPAALKSMLEGFGVSVGYGRLREACQTEVDGTSIDTLEELAVALGLQAEQIMVPPDHVLLPEANALPAIAVVRLPNGFTHFVVIWRRHGPLLQIMDPSGGRRWTSCRAFLDELYVHTHVVPADAFREYAGHSEHLGALRARFGAIDVDRKRREAWIARALSDPSWRTIAALDAVLRMVTVLVRGKAIAEGREAGNLIDRFFEEALRDPSTVPDEYWTVRAHEEEENLRLRGAVLVRAQSARALGATEDAPLPLELRAALTAEPERPLARLAALLREDGFLAPSAVVLSLALSALGVLVEALVFRGAIDLADRLRLAEQRIGIGGALMLLFVALLALQVPVAATTMRLGRHLEARLRVAFLRKIPRLSDRYFHSRLTSDMAQRAHSVHALRVLPGLGAAFLSSAFSLVATVGGLIWLAPSNVGWVIAVAVLSVALPLALTPLMTERDLRVQTHFGALSRFYLDALLGLAPLRAHGAERALRREHEGLLLEWERASFALQRVMVSTDVVMAASGVLLTAWLVYTYLGSGGAVAGALLLVYWALRVPALGQAVAQSARQYPHVRNVALRLLEPLGAPEEPEPTDAIEDHRESAATIRFEDVTVRAGGHVLLEGVSLELAPGSKVAVVGPSGAGKSTFVGLLLGWHRPAQGSVLVDGAPLDAARLRALRRRTAWVDPAVQIWNRTLVRNLRYGSDAERAPLSRVLEEAHLLALLQSLPDGLSTVLGEGGALVSGGEGQRVRLGRAMMRGNARLAILDEPFRGLDRETRRAMMRSSLAHFASATVLCVTHDVAETTHFDRVIVIDQGRVVEDGAPGELSERSGSLYRKLLGYDRALRAALWDAGEFKRMRMVDGTIEEVS